MSLNTLLNPNNLNLYSESMSCNILKSPDFGGEIALGVTDNRVDIGSVSTDIYLNGSLYNPSGNVDYTVAAPINPTDANGLIIDNTLHQIKLEFADGTHPGIVNNNPQTYSGLKTFSSGINTSNLNNPASTLTLGNTATTISIGNAASSTLNFRNNTLQNLNSNITSAGGAYSLVNSANIINPVLKGISGAAVTNFGTYLNIDGITGPTGPSGPGVSAYADVSNSFTSLIYRGDGSSSTSLAQGNLYMKTIEGTNGITIINNPPYSNITISGSTISGVTDVQNTGSGSVGLVSNPSAPTPTIKGLSSNSGTITFSDMGSYVSLDSAGITGPTGPTGPGSPVNNSSFSGPIAVLQQESPSSPVLVKGITGAAGINISDSGNYLTVEAGSIVTSSGAGYQSLLNGTNQLTELQAGQNVSIVPNSGYLQLNSFVFGNGASGVDMTFNNQYVKKIRGGVGITVTDNLDGSITLSVP